MKSKLLCVEIKAPALMNVLKQYTDAMIAPKFGKILSGFFNKCPVFAPDICSIFILSDGFVLCFLPLLSSEGWSNHDPFNLVESKYFSEGREK